MKSVVSCLPIAFYILTLGIMQKKKMRQKLEVKKRNLRQINCALNWPLLYYFINMETRGYVIQLPLNLS